MTSEDNSELKELVLQALEKEGSLARLKAEVRAAVCSILEDSLEPKAPQPQTSAVSRLESDCLEKGCGHIMISLVHDFLSFYNLHLTQKVFESDVPACSMVFSRDQLCQSLHIQPTAIDGRPVLEVLINNACTIKPPVTQS